MPSRDPFMKVLSSFVANMSESCDRTEMCYQLCDHTIETIGVTGAGVAVVDDHENLRFVTATSERIVEIERIQEEKQEGPCVVAFTTQTPVAISEIQAIEGWAPYKAVAEEVGLKSVIGIPLVAGEVRLGAFNVYHDEIREWTPEDIAIATVFSDMATAYLIRTSELAESRQLADQLQGALSAG